MSFDISRREFLKALVSVGAVIVLPIPLAEATAAEVDEAWDRLVKDPWFFEVSYCGTITVPDVPEPKINSDVFNLSTNTIRTPEDLIDVMRCCVPLAERFRSMARDEYDALMSEIDFYRGTNRNAVRRLTRRTNLLEDENNGWRYWVRSQGKTGLPKLTKEIEDWLEDSLDWSQMESWPRGWSGQDEAKSYFEDDSDLADSLGIIIVEGDCPGSSYFAAELTSSVEYVNEVAEELGLPFRFRAEGSGQTRSV